MEPVRSVISKHSTAPPRFCRVREVEAKTSPSTVTFPDSSVRSPMGVSLPFMLRPISTSPVGAPLPADSLRGGTMGLGLGKSALISTLCKL